jgi:hypothetical protein
MMAIGIPCHLKIVGLNTTFSFIRDGIVHYIATPLAPYPLFTQLTSYFRVFESG